MRHYARLAAHICILAVFCAQCTRVSAMHVRWNRMTGQTPVETAPLVASLDPRGPREIFALNRGGQLMAWSLAGVDLGEGQDGTVAQLPTGRWTSTPALFRGSGGARIAACSVEGLVVCLDRHLRVLWQRSLPGTTMWGRAFAAILPPLGRPGAGALCFGDESGAVTCLAPDGGVVWSVRPGNGPCRAPLQIMMGPEGRSRILAACGTELCCLDAAGRLLWRANLGGRILTRPEALRLGDRALILCGAGSGALCGISAHGRILWRTPIGDEIDTSIALMPRAGRTPLILSMGVSGGLHAVDIEGRIAWSHLYHARARCVPLVFEAGGRTRIAVALNSEHLCLFDSNGDLSDDLRLGGGGVTSPLALPNAAGGGSDLLVITSSMTALRIAADRPVSPYGPSGAPAHIVVGLASPLRVGERPSLVVSNPRGALLLLNVSAAGGRSGAGRLVQGVATVRSELEVPLLPELRVARALHVVVRDPAGRVLVDRVFAAPPVASHALGVPALAWAETPYADFDPRRPVPSAGHPAAVRVSTLYRSEVGAGAFAIAPRAGGDREVVLRVSPPKRRDGARFGGAITLRRVAMVGTIDGEMVADALPELPADGGSGAADDLFRGTLTVPTGRAEKIWMNVDSRGAAPGLYRARIDVAAGRARASLSLEIEVMRLSLPARLPLRLCTWDYVPNRWFPNRTSEVLEDMVRHGVSVFPRSECIPKATAGPDGALSFAWQPLDQELARLKGRGVLLLQMGEPPIAFPAGIAEAARQAARVAYVRALRDHLRAGGWGYDDYAFYPVDEPGLDHGPRISPLLDAAKLVHTADPKLRVYADPVPGLSWRDYLRVEPSLDVWCPNMHLVSGLLTGDPRMRRIMRFGKPVWSYECVSQVKSLSPLCYNRGAAWRAWHFGLQGIGFWTHSMVTVDPWKANADRNDEYALVYPGDTPVPSVRWEAVRAGLQDIAAMAMLRDRVRALRRRRPAAPLVACAEEELRIADADAMEISDRAFVQSRDYLKQGDRRIWHTPSDEAAFNRHRARIAALTLALDAVRR